MIPATSIPMHAQAPMWPWILLLALVAWGIAMSRPRLMTVRRAVILPLVLAVVSLAGVRSAFGIGPVPLGAWLLGVAAAAGLAMAAGWPRGVTWRVDAYRVQVPGSWWPLAIFLAIFASRFAVGAATAMKWPVLTEPGFVAGMSLLYGAFSGVLLGRAATIWRAVPLLDDRLLPTAAPATPRP